MWNIRHYLHCKYFIFKNIFIYIVIMAIVRKTEGCGSYIKIGRGGSASVSSGSSYGPYVHCLWWIETDSGNQLSLNITSYEGDYNYGRCGDYIIIRNSTDTGSLLLDSRADSGGNCSTLTNHIVTASSSWLRVQFYSDGINSTSGFHGHISSTYVGSSLSKTNPMEECKSYEMQCSNKVCMTLSYRCDGFNDCGCDKDCDESGCQGLNLGKYEIMLIGGLMGLAMFLAFFIFAYSYESYLRRRTLMADPEAQAELQRKKAEEKRKAAYKKAAKEKKGRR